MRIRIQSPAIINHSWKWLEDLFHGLKIKNISSALKPKLLITAPAPQSNSATAPQTNSSSQNNSAPPAPAPQH